MRTACELLVKTQHSLNDIYGNPVYNKSLVKYISDTDESESKKEIWHNWVLNNAACSSDGTSPTDEPRER